MLEIFLESLTKFYGFDWGAMIFTFLQLYLLGIKKRYGFLLGCVANICWICFNLLAGSAAGVIANIVFIIMSIRGYVQWNSR